MKLPHVITPPMVADNLLKNERLDGVPQKPIALHPNNTMDRGIASRVRWETHRYSEESSRLPDLYRQ